MALRETDLSGLNLAVAELGLRLRPLAEDDEVTVRTWLADPEIKYYMDQGRHEGRRDPLNPAEGERVTAILQDEKLIGYVQFCDWNPRRRSGELRMCIGEKDLWGQGLGTISLQLFLQQLFAETRVDQVYLRVYSDNARAIRCYQKSGFQLEGVLRGGHRGDGRNIWLMRTGSA